MRAIVSDVGAGSNRPRRALGRFRFGRLVSPASRMSTPNTAASHVGNPYEPAGSAGSAPIPSAASFPKNPFVQSSWPMRLGRSST